MYRAVYHVASICSIMQVISGEKKRGNVKRNIKYAGNAILV